VKNICLGVISPKRTFFLAPILTGYPETFSYKFFIAFDVRNKYHSGIVVFKEENSRGT